MPSVYEDDFRPLELDKVSTYPLASRPSKVSLNDFANPLSEDSSLRDFLQSLPNILAVQSLRKLAASMRRARELRKPIIWGIGGHVIKTGLAPLVIDLMKRGFVTAIAGNGSVLVHDAEIAMVGSTSEDVDATLGEGIFGGADETGKLLNRAALEGAKEDIGLGEATGRNLLALSPKHADHSLLCSRLSRAGALHRSFDDRRRHRALSPASGRRRARRYHAYRFSTALGTGSPDGWRRRLLKYRISSDPAGSLSKGCYAGAQPWQPVD